MAITEEQIMRAAGEPDREGPPWHGYGTNWAAAASPPSAGHD